MKTVSKKHTLFASFKPAIALALFCCLVLGFAQLAQAAETQVDTTSIENTVETVSINTADAEAIAAALKGVGLKKAQAIIEWRNQNGQFTRLEQLLEIKGIGEKTLEKNRSYIRL